MQLWGQARLRALKATFLVLAGVAMLAIFPAGGLPNYVPQEIPPVSPEEPTMLRKPDEEAQEEEVVDVNR